MLLIFNIFIYLFIYSVLFLFLFFFCQGQDCQNTDDGKLPGITFDFL